MLYFNNDRRIDANADTPEAKQFKNWCENEWKDLPNSVIIKRNAPIKINPSGAIEPDAGMSIPLEATFEGDFGTETWRYTETAPNRDNNTGNLVFFDSRMYINRNKVINKNRKDLLFFLLTKCPQMLNGYFIVENKEKEAARKSEEAKIKAEVYSFIYLSEDDEKIKEIAIKWGIDINKKSIHEIKNALFEIVETSQKKGSGGFMKFIKELYVTPQTDTNIEIKKRGAPKGGWPKKT